MLNTASPTWLAGDFKATLRPEAALLLCCARLDLQSGDREKIVRLLETDLDWTYLLDMAARHGLRPLLFRHLNAIASAGVPKAIFARLWASHESTNRRNHAMAKELLKILALLDANGIAAIPYKGPLWLRPYTATSHCASSTIWTSFCDRKMCSPPRRCYRRRAISRYFP